MGFRKRKEENENKIKNLKLQDNNQAIDMEALNKAFAGDLSSSKVVNSGQVNEVAETANITGGPSLATVQKATPADAIKEAASKKALAGNLAMAQQGKDLLFPDDGSTESGALGGALGGAQMGAKFGPKGAIIGGIIGGVAGGLDASSKQKAAYKKAKAEAAAKHHGKLELIEKEKDRKIQGALESMKGAFSRNLQNNKQVKL